MSATDEILSQIPLGDLAARLGVDEATAGQAARQALPALLGDMQANAVDPAGARSLSAAVGQHDPALIDGGVDLAQVDTEDGQRILGHVMGGQELQAVNQLSGGGQDLMAKLLPLLAPIVMSYLAKKFGGAPAADGQGGGGLGDLLGGLLGGAQNGTPGAGGLGDLLGGLLGNERR